MTDTELARLLERNRSSAYDLLARKLQRGETLTPKQEQMLYYLLLLHKADTLTIKELFS